MGIITGYIALTCFLLLVVKFIAKRASNQKLNRLLGGIHKPVSCIFFIICILHLILVIPVLSARNLFVVCSGFFGLGVVVLLIVFCHVIKQGRKKMYWHRAMSLLLFVMLVIHMITYFIDFSQYKTNIKGLKIMEVDLSTVPNGTYIGNYDAGYIYAKVQVTIQAGVITNIEILQHKTERGKKAETIIDKIKSEQRLEVDAVSGATNSSLVIEKAVENALEHALQ